LNPLSAVIPAGQRKRDLRELGVQVIKGVGELQDFEGPVGTAFGLIGEVFERHPEEAEWIRRALLGVLLVLDPDGFFGGGARPAGRVMTIRPMRATFQDFHVTVR